MRSIAILLLCCALVSAAERAPAPANTDDLARAFNTSLLALAKQVAAQAPARPVLTDADTIARQKEVDALTTKWARHWRLQELVKLLERELDPKNKNPQVLRVEVYNNLQEIEQGR